METYGFDGLDIDLEQLAITVGDNQTVNPCRIENSQRPLSSTRKNFIITMAPEFLI